MQRGQLGGGKIVRRASDRLVAERGVEVEGGDVQREDLRRDIKKPEDRAWFIWRYKAYGPIIGGQELCAARCALLVLTFEIQDFDVLESGLPLRVGSRLVWDDDRGRGRRQGQRFLFF